MPMIAVLAEIVEAFKSVYPDEMVRSVEYDVVNGTDKEIFAIKSCHVTSSVMAETRTRRYFRSDPARPFADILRETPQLD